MAYEQHTHARADLAFTGSRRGVYRDGATLDPRRKRRQGSSSIAHPVASANRWGVSAARLGPATKRSWTTGILWLLRVRWSGWILTATPVSYGRRSGHYLAERRAMQLMSGSVVRLALQGLLHMHVGAKSRLLLL